MGVGPGVGVGVGAGGGGGDGGNFFSEQISCINLASLLIVKLIL